jgi:hypothetical protein
VSLWPGTLTRNCHHRRPVQTSLLATVVPAFGREYDIIFSRLIFTSSALPHYDRARVIRNCSTAENTTHAANGSEALQTILDAYVIGTSRISDANWCPMRCRLSSGPLTNLGNQASSTSSTNSATLGVVRRRRTTARSSAPTARQRRTFAKSTKSRRLSRHAFAATMLDRRSGRSSGFARTSTPTRRRAMFGMFAPADHGCGN